MRAAILIGSARLLLEGIQKFRRSRDLGVGIQRHHVHETILVYLHVMTRPGLTATSPLDRIRE